MIQRYVLYLPRGSFFWHLKKRRNILTFHPDLGRTIFFSHTFPTLKKKNPFNCSVNMTNNISESYKQANHSVFFNQWGHSEKSQWPQHCLLELVHGYTNPVPNTLGKSLDGILQWGKCKKKFNMYTMSPQISLEPFVLHIVLESCLEKDGKLGTGVFSTRNLCFCFLQIPWYFYEREILF